MLQKGGFQMLSGCGEKEVRLNTVSLRTPFDVPLKFPSSTGAPPRSIPDTIDAKSRYCLVPAQGLKLGFELSTDCHRRLSLNAYSRLFPDSSPSVSRYAFGEKFFPTPCCLPQRPETMAISNHAYWRFGFGYWKPFLNGAMLTLRRGDVALHSFPQASQLALPIVWQNAGGASVVGLGKPLVLKPPPPSWSVSPALFAEQRDDRLLPGQGPGSCTSGLEGGLSIDGWLNSGSSASQVRLYGGVGVEQSRQQTLIMPAKKEETGVRGTFGFEIKF